MENVFTLLESATSEYYVWLCAGPSKLKGVGSKSIHTAMFLLF